MVSTTYDAASGLGSLSDWLAYEQRTLVEGQRVFEWTASSPTFTLDTLADSLHALSSDLRCRLHQFIKASNRIIGIRIGTGASTPRLELASVRSAFQARMDRTDVVFRGPMRTTFLVHSPHRASTAATSARRRRPRLLSPSFHGAYDPPRGLHYY